MATVPDSTSSDHDREPIRLALLGEAPRDGTPDGTWWPRSRDMQAELADLVDHFPAERGRVNRLLFSRPDWDDPTTPDGRGVRRIRARRGNVKIGSFPGDDTRLVTLVMATHDRLDLLVVQSSTDEAEAARLLAAGGVPVPS